MARFPWTKTLDGTPCLYDITRMYTDTNMSSWIDLCMTPMPNAALGRGYGYSCTNCPVGPFLDYTYLVSANSPLCPARSHRLRF